MFCMKHLEVRLQNFFSIKNQRVNYNLRSRGKCLGGQRVAPSSRQVARIIHQSLTCPLRNSTHNCSSTVSSFRQISRPADSLSSPIVLLFKGFSSDNNKIPHQSYEMLLLRLTCFAYKYSIFFGTFASRSKLRLTFKSLFVSVIETGRVMPETHMVCPIHLSSVTLRKDVNLTIAYSGIP